MFFLTYGEKGPKVVLVQTLMRLHNIDVQINGHWQQECMKAVEEYRAKLNLRPLGSIDGKVFFNLLQGSKLKVIDSLDASAGDVADITKREMKAAGVKVLLNKRVPGHGVEKAVDNIVERSKNHRIALLRIFGHGNGGNWLSVALGNPFHLRTSGSEADMAKYNVLKADWKSYIDNNHFGYHKKSLVRISPLFASFGSVELHSCTIGSTQQEMIQKMADTWGVPVTAGKGDQMVGTYYKDAAGKNVPYFKNKWGEVVPFNFVMEGEVFRAYPNGGNLQKWAASVEASVPNLVRWFSKIKQGVSNIFGN